MTAKLIAACRRLENWPGFDLLVAFLILLSVVLLGVEAALPPASLARERILLLEEAMTTFFIVELLIRFVAMRRRSRFLREYWLDVLAVVPMLRVFRFARFLRLLRLLRLFRLAQLLTSHFRLFDHLLSNRLGEYLLMGLLVVFATVAGTLGITLFEHPHGSSPQVLANSFWVSVFSIFSGEYSTQFPTTLGGRLTMLLVEFTGLSLFAVMTGTVSVVMMEKLREGTLFQRMLFEDMENHVIICGWNSGLEKTLFELQSHADFAEREYIVVTERDGLPEMRNLPQRSRVHFLRADFTRVEVLQRANVMRAAVAIIVSEIDSHRTRQDADARTVLAALTIEKLNPNVYSIAELSNGMNEPHLRMGNVNEVIISRDITGHLLAQAALHSANAQVLHVLLRSKEGNSLLPYPVGPDYAGQEFGQILNTFRQRTGHIPIGVQNASGEVVVNPESHTLAEGEIIVCV